MTNTNELTGFLNRDLKIVVRMWEVAYEISYDGLSVMIMCFVLCVQ